MNKVKQEIEIRKVLNQIRHTSRSGSKKNYFYAYASETEDHITKKFKLWLKLRKSGYDCLCEPIFNSGIRMDVLAWKNGIFTNYEILESERIKELKEKTKKYPNIDIITIKTEEDINKLNL